MSLGEYSFGFKSGKAVARIIGDTDLAGRKLTVSAEGEDLESRDWRALESKLEEIGMSRDEVRRRIAEARKTADPAKLLDTTRTRCAELPPGHLFQPTPICDDQHYFIFGATGQGKSYFISKFVDEYRKMYPRNTVIIFTDSRGREDVKPSVKAEEKEAKSFIESFVDEEPETEAAREYVPFSGNVSYVTLNRNIQKMKPENMANMLVIFDDVDKLGIGSEGESEAVGAMVRKLRDNLLMKGRKNHVSVMTSSHLMSDHKNTRYQQGECANFVWFPQSPNPSLARWLKDNMGIDTKAKREWLVHEMRNTRWVMLHKNTPVYFISETRAWMLPNSFTGAT